VSKEEKGRGEEPDMSTHKAKTHGLSAQCVLLESKKDNQYRDCFNFYFVLKNNKG